MREPVGILIFRLGTVTVLHLPNEDKGAAPPWHVQFWPADPAANHAVTGEQSELLVCGRIQLRAKGAGCDVIVHSGASFRRKDMLIICKSSPRSRLSGVDSKQVGRKATL